MINYVVVAGTFSEGFRVYGPFVSEEKAKEWATQAQLTDLIDEDHSWWWDVLFTPLDVVA